jgi:hypothetical protein
MRLLHLIAASSLSGCIIPESWTLAAHDVDRDGHVAVVFGGDDCDDANARAYEGAVELCSTGRDEDCDGEVDEAGVGAVTVWLDTDGDGFGDPNRQLTTCKASPQYALRAGDCDDGVRDVHPGARELCNDRDDDCDLAIDEGAPPTTWYPDVDADGFGDPTRPTSACLPPADGWLALGADCDDAVAAVNPAAADVPYDGLDADCDGASDFDVDGDGWDFPTDCDDADRDIHPAAAEVPYDDVDDDCAPGNEHDLDRDGVTGPAWPLGADCDDRSPLIAGPSVYYPDVDGDTYGDPAGAVVACQPPPGHVLQAGDCDDRAASVNPIAIETCDGADQDCDGAIDEGAGEAWYPDRDRDGRGDTLAFSVRSCGLPADPTVPAWSLTPDDCDDTRGDVYTGAPERCDLTDNDCDTLIDEGVTPTWHRDDDADGVGTAESAFACAPPADWLGAVRGGPTGDCDDARADVFPGATEVCDLTDQDCDGLIDEGVTPTWHRDDDADEYATAEAVAACEPPAHWLGWRTSPTAIDCDDARADVFPGATEVCDLTDQDCDSLVDEGVTPTWHRDDDADDYATAEAVAACDPPAHWIGWRTSPTTLDCDDARADVFPGATEVCDLTDQDCDALVDEGVTPTWHRDDDGDTFATAERVAACQPPPHWSGWRTSSTTVDCDDARADVFPGATEVCDRVDQDCDALTDEGVTPTWHRDEDLDGYGTAQSSTTCAAPAAWAGATEGPTAIDCEDDNPDRHPGAEEVCNGLEDNCDADWEVTRPAICAVDAAAAVVIDGSLYVLRSIRGNWEQGAAWCSQQGSHLIWPAGLGRSNPRAGVWYEGSMELETVRVAMGLPTGSEVLIGYTTRCVGRQSREYWGYSSSIVDCDAFDSVVVGADPLPPGWEADASTTNSPYWRHSLAQTFISPGIQVFGNWHYTSVASSMYAICEQEN